VRGPLGDIEATIHRPHERKLWRLCYATCTGVLAHLQGKVIDACTLGYIKDVLERHDHQLNPEIP
jgi:hypothetical protein